jgi:suppressor of fused
MTLLMSTIEDQAPGLDAINRALDNFYGEKPYGLFSENELTGSASSALEAISVYRSQADRPHWHFITFGFSELFEKESENSELSGLGFELTFRLATSTAIEPQTPEWACRFLNDLARMILENGTHVQAGDHLALGSPIAPDSGSRLDSILFVRDSELGSIETKNGRVDFIQVVGLTSDERSLLERWRGEKFIESAKIVLGTQLITDLKRESFANNPVVIRSFDQAVTAGGVADVTIDCAIAEWIFTYKASVLLGVDCISQLQENLVSCISGGRRVTVKGAESTIIFRKGKEANFTIENDVLIIDCTAADAQSFVTQLKPMPGSYSFANLPLGIEVTDGRGLDMMDSLPNPATKTNKRKTKK